MTTTTNRSANRTGIGLRDLWTSACKSLAAYRDRKSAAVLYSELSKLSDAELTRRGISRADLHRMVSELDER